MEPEQKSNGALVGLIIIVIILAIGAIYIWVSNKNATEKIPPVDQSNVVTDQDSADLNALGLEAQAIDTNTGVDASTIN